MVLRMQEKGTLMHCWWDCKLAQPLWKIIWRVLKKTKHRSAIWSSNTTPRDIPKGMRLRLFQRTCTPMFIAALFTIAKLWKQPRSPTTDEWIKKMWYLYRMEFYSVTKKNDILSFTSKWMELENITLNEVSQAQKAKNCVFSPMCGL
jgi:hypothetical protein